MKKRVWLIIGIILSTALVAFISVWFVQKHTREKRIDEYLAPYKQQAIAYLEENDKDLLGCDMEFDDRITEVGYGYKTKEYFAAIRNKYPKSAEEFEEKVEYIKFTFEISYDEECTVQFNKDSHGKLYISAVNCETEK